MKTVMYVTKTDYKKVWGLVEDRGAHEVPNFKSDYLSCEAGNLFSNSFRIRIVLLYNGINFITGLTKRTRRHFRAPR